MSSKGIEQVTLFFIALIMWAQVGYSIVSSLEVGYLASIVALQVAVFFVPFLAYKLITKQKFGDFVPIRAIGIKNALFIFFMLLCIYPVGVFLRSIVFLFYDFSYIFAYSHEELLGATFLLSALVVSLAPSIFEELVFRGVIQYNLSEFPIKKAALINGLLFGILHFNVIQFISGFIIGAVLAYFMHYTRSILAPMLGHFIWNFGITTLLFVVYDFYDPLYDFIEGIGYYTDPVRAIMLVSGIASLALFVPFVILMKRFIAHNVLLNLNKS